MRVFCAIPSSEERSELIELARHAKRLPPFRLLGLGQRPHAERKLERAKGIGPSTRSLGSYCSTTELHPRPPRGASMAQSGPKGKIGLTRG